MRYDLNKIREFIIKQEKEFEEFMKNILSDENMDSTYTDDKQFVQNSNLITELEYIKLNIEDNINNKNFEKAKKLIQEYKNIADIDADYYSMRGIVDLQENNLESALDNFLKGLEIDEYNIDILYNMGYMNFMLNNLEESLYFYNKCLEICEDREFIKELNYTISNILTEIEKHKTYTFVGINLDNNDYIFNNIDNKHNLINIIENEKITEPDLYYVNSVKVYEVESSKIMSMIQYIIRKNKNVVLIVNDVYKFKYLIEFKNKIKLVYYQDTNFYTDKNNILDKSINLFLEKECCKDSDYIITSNVEVYNFKKILEGRKNVYLVNDNLSLNNIINGSYIDFDLEILEDDMSEYDKIMYKIYNLIDYEQDLMNYIEDIIKDNQCEVLMKIYSSILLKDKKYEILINFLYNNKFLNKIYVAECIYLYSIKKYDLIDFVVHIALCNFALADVDTEDDIEYRVAVLNFETTRYDTAYKEYMDIIDKNMVYLSSPMTNRNISYLMYMNDDEKYKEYYTFYKELVNSI